MDNKTLVINAVKGNYSDGKNITINASKDFMRVNLTLEPQIDKDGDGFGPAMDCNDTNASINPDAEEICDGLDNDCDGQVDEGVKTTFYNDSDEDGYGNSSETLEACDSPEGYVQEGGDCDDTNASWHPGVDSDCDGVNDSEDAILGTAQDMDTNLNLSLSVDGEENPNTSNGTRKVTLEQDGEEVVSFRNNFTNNTLDFSKISVSTSNDSSAMQVNGLQPEGTKNITLKNANNISTVCVKDAENASFAEITESCTGENEHLVTCDGTLQGDYSCNYTNSSNTSIRVSGLAHSAAKQQTGCGDGILQGDEQCDGDSLNGETCEDRGYDGGDLACNADCTFDTSACTEESDTGTTSSGGGDPAPMITSTEENETTTTNETNETTTEPVTNDTEEDSTEDTTSTNTTETDTEANETTTSGETETTDTQGTADTNTDTEEEPDSTQDTGPTGAVTGPLGDLDTRWVVTGIAFLLIVSMAAAALMTNRKGKRPDYEIR